MIADLSYRERAELFAQLATMEESALSFDKALSILQSAQGQVGTRAARTREQVAKGVDLATAGEKSALFNRLEVTLMRVALAAGSPAVLYRRLATFYARKSLLQGRVRAQMVLPAAVFTLAVLLAPVPAVASGAISIGGYLLRTALWLGGAWLLFVGFRSIPDTLLRALPVIGPLRERAQVRDYFESLALMLEAGLPLLDALPKALAAVQDGAVQGMFRPIERRVRAGETFAQALTALPKRWHAALEPYAGSGEAAGRLPESLFRYCEIESAAIDGRLTLIADWLPRLAYVAAAIYAAVHVLGSGAFMPRP